MSQKNKYISLQEASKLCKYSQDYLSLRARYGKLKAVKVGRNWATKKEWLREFVTYQKKKHRKSLTFKVPIIPIKKPEEIKPLDLPVEVPKNLSLQFAFLFSFAWILLIVAAYFTVSDMEITSGTAGVFKEFGFWAGSKGAALIQNSFNSIY